MGGVGGEGTEFEGIGMEDGRMVLLCTFLGYGEMIGASSHAGTDTRLKIDMDIVRMVEVILD